MHSQFTVVFSFFVAGSASLVFFDPFSSFPLKQRMTLLMASVPCVLHSLITLVALLTLSISIEIECNSVLRMMLQHNQSFPKTKTYLN